MKRQKLKNQKKYKNKKRTPIFLVSFFSVLMIVLAIILLNEPMKKNIPQSLSRWIEKKKEVLIKEDEILYRKKERKTIVKKKNQVKKPQVMGKK